MNTTVYNTHLYNKTENIRVKYTGMVECYVFLAFFKIFIDNAFDVYSNFHKNITVADADDIITQHILDFPMKQYCKIEFENSHIYKDGKKILLTTIYVLLFDNVNFLNGHEDEVDWEPYRIEEFVFHCL